MAGVLISQQGSAVPPSASDQYQTKTGVSAAYQLRLEVRGDEQLLSSGGRIFPIVAALPERYSIDLSSNWTTPFAGTDAAGLTAARYGDRAGAAVTAILGATGISSRVKSQSAQVWESSSPLSFSIQLNFHALSNTETDVRDKHRALLKLVAPSEIAGQILVQPGPTLIGQAADSLGFSSNSRQITLYLGKYLMLENVVVKSVSSDISTMCDEKGIPIEMSINLQVESFYSCFTSQDIDKMFIS